MTIIRTLTDVGCLLNHLPWEPWCKPFSPNSQIKQKSIFILKTETKTKKIQQRQQQQQSKDKKQPKPLSNIGKKTTQKLEFHSQT